jgi:hypothetical protein
MTMKALQALAVALLLAACVTATPYQPRTGASGYGYSDQRIEPNRFRLTFRGNSATDREQVENYLLYRAAELTLQNGYDYFVIVTRATDAKSTLQGYGYGRYPYHPFFFEHRFFSPRFGWRGFYDPFWDDPMNYREITQYEASAEIVMYKGRKPADDPRAFDAREVQANLQGRVTAPPTPR